MTDWPTLDPSAEQPATPGAAPLACGPAELDLGLRGTQVLVLGLGASGLAMARWCVAAGAHVTVADTRSAPPQWAALQRDCPNVRWVSGAFGAALLDAPGRIRVAVSPGLSPAQIAPLFEAAQARLASDAVEFCGELTLFAQALSALRTQAHYSPAVLAISGTNGKTTTTALTAHLVERAGRSVALAGNIGPSLLDTLHAHLQAGTRPEVWVLELSSFQLDAVQGFAPSAAAVLNLSQDHLDWHAGMDAYAAAKARIFGPHSVRVLNRDDPLVWAMQPAAPPPPATRAARRAQAGDRVAVHSFGADLPRRAGDFGLESIHGVRWLVWAEPHDATAPGAGHNADGAFVLRRLMPADALRIRGLHNALNALAALALAQAAGCALAPMLYGLREYRGEPHRVQPVGWVGEVEYIDDSKGTNVGATLAALNGLGAERRLVVILGGQGKGQDFSPLAEAVRAHARAVALIGADAQSIRAALADTGVVLHDAGDLRSAVAWAATQAHSGDAVLLSPACASLDQFRDYAERAAVFVAAVQALAEQSGGTLEGGACD